MCFAAWSDGHHWWWRRSCKFLPLSVTFTERLRSVLTLATANEHICHSTRLRDASPCAGTCPTTETVRFSNLWGGVLTKSMCS